MSANDKQVGGRHYAQGENPQHWDLVQMYGWDYFQGQITKYLMRWKFKYKTTEARIEDLKKARHFLDKYIELAERGEPEVGEQLVSPEITVSSLPPRFSFESHEKDSPRYTSDSQFLCEGGWGDGNNLYKCLSCRTLVKAHDLAGAHTRHYQCVPPTGTLTGTV